MHAISYSPRFRYLDFSLSMKAVLAEFVSLTIFVFVGTLHKSRS